MQSRNLGMFLLFVAQLGARGSSWAKGLGPKPNPFVGWAGLGLGRRGLWRSLGIENVKF